MGHAVAKQHVKATADKAAAANLLDKSGVGVNGVYEVSEEPPACLHRGCIVSAAERCKPHEMIGM